MPQLVVRVAGRAIAATTAFSVAVPAPRSPETLTKTYALLVVKAELAPDPTGALCLVDPAPIQPARDLAPYLPSVQVVVDAAAPSQDVVRLLVGRGERVAVDAVGPLAWLVTPQARDEAATRLLAAMEPKGEPARVERGFDWTALFEVPPDRRMPALAGDEWIRLSGARTFSGVLPQVRAEARLHGSAPALRAGRKLKLTGDTVRIDLERSRIALFWRCSVEVPDLADLDTLRAVAGVAIGGAAIEWVDPFADPPPPAKTPPARPASRFERTVALDEPDDEVARARRMLAALAPFTGKTAPPPRPAPRPAPSPPPKPPPKPAPSASAGGEGSNREITADISSTDFVPKPATPFERTPEASPSERRAASPGQHPHSGTLELDPVAAAHAGARPATPFAGSSPPPVARAVEPPGGPPPWISASVVVSAPSVVEVVEARPEPPPPARMDEPPPPLAAEPERPATIGAAYLAAAEKAGRKKKAPPPPPRKRARRV